jgi:hypothetical protein
MTNQTYERASCSSALLKTTIMDSNLHKVGIEERKDTFRMLSFTREYISMMPLFVTPALVAFGAARGG